jgi:hypothetical protein
MKPLKIEVLLRWAAKYIWWKTPEEAVRRPERIVAQIMNIGDYDDVQVLVREVDEEYLRELLRRAEAGQFNEKSWSYWHYRLGLCEPGRVPALPERRTV